jgi:hypothetical protein
MLQVNAVGLERIIAHYIEEAFTCHNVLIYSHFKAHQQGKGDVVTGWQNKRQTTIANVTPAGRLAERHRQIAEPGSGKPETDTGEPL